MIYFAKVILFFHISHEMHNNLYGMYDFYYEINISIMNTTKVQITATGKRPKPHQAHAMPIISAMKPAKGDCVASRMAGNVMTASVT